MLFTFRSTSRTIAEPGRAIIAIFATLALLLVGLVVATPASADWVPSSTTQVSVGNDGNGTTSQSLAAAVSDDGEVVTFTSWASNLVSGDDNDTADIFVRNMSTGVTTLVSRAMTGGPGNDTSFSSDISADGRYIVFESDASDLVAGDTNGSSDVFLYEVPTGSMTLVSRTSAGVSANGFSAGASISADGRYVAFVTWTSDLVPGATAFSGVALYEIATGSISLPISEAIQSLDISADGRFIVYDSPSHHPALGDDPGSNDVFRYDTVTGVTQLVTPDNGGVAQTSTVSLEPHISGDGRVVTYVSAETDLVAGDTNGFFDVFVYDFTTGVTSLVSADVAGGPSNGASYWPRISGDGGSVVYRSRASDLVAGDTNANTDIFIYNVATGVNSIASVSSSGGLSNGFEYSQNISNNGQHVVYSSSATNLVNGYLSGGDDVYITSSLCNGLVPNIVAVPGVTTVGSGNGDVIAGTAGPDVIVGGGGDDVICGNGGDDLIVGGTGNDTILGGDGADRIFGDLGADTIFGGAGLDRIRGGAGNDVISGGADRDVILGDAGIDTIHGDGGRDSLFGGDNGDTIDGGADTDLVRGQGGADTLRTGTSGNDRLVGGTGNDILDGRATSGSTRMLGEAGDDTFYGSEQLDRMWGHGGNDTMYGRGFSDLLRGGEGDDVMYGESGRDTLDGGNGNDYLSGGAGNGDKLVGMAGTDACDGGFGIGDFAHFTCENVSGIP